MNILEEIQSKHPHKVVLSKGKGEYKKIVLLRKVIKSQNVYQLEKYTETQVFHENVPEDTFAAKVGELFPGEFRQLNAFTADMDYDVKGGKKGNLAINRRAATVKSVTIGGNDRKKKYILDEGMDIPAFYELGIFTKEGKVAAKMQDKFRQINRFIEMVDDVLKDYKAQEIHIIDFGCGKSYLTFFLYHYLVELRGVNAHIVGLDLKEQVIANCAALADKCGYKNLRFELGDINGYKSDAPVNMVVTLHACDTATDYALYNAITWNAKYILSVPCCQHEVNKQLKSHELSALTKYGIIKERTSALVTDAIRGCLLESAGYKTDLLEFIDIEHSPKNILIRAVKKNISRDKRARALKEATDLAGAFAVEQTLMKLMNATGEAQELAPSIEDVAAAVREIIADGYDKGKLTYMADILQGLTTRFNTFALADYGYTRVGEFVKASVPGVTIVKDANGVPHAELLDDRDAIEEFITKCLAVKEKRTCAVADLMEAIAGAYPHFDVRNYGYTYDVAFLLSFPKVKLVDTAHVQLKQSFKLSDRVSEE